MLTVRQSVVGVVAIVGLIFAGTTATSGADHAEAALLAAGVGVGSASPTRVNLGTTAGGDQYAQALVSGLTDGRHVAAFGMRYTSQLDRVLVAVSGAGWQVSPSGAATTSGTFPHGVKGTFRVEVRGQTVRVLWNGRQVATRKLTTRHTGRGVLVSVTPGGGGVTMRSVEASTLSSARRSTAPVPPTSTSTRSSAAQSSGEPQAGAQTLTTTTSGVGTTTGTTATTGETTGTTTPAGSSTSGRPDGSWPSSSSSAASSSSSTPPVSSSSTSSMSTSSSAAPSTVPNGSRTWLSGSSGEGMANGTWQAWRGSSAGIAGAWDDDADGQANLWSICQGGQYVTWNKPLDYAIGGLQPGETWSAAARGAYDARWTQIFTKIKTCWGSRDPGNLYIRFAHEMNIPAYNWMVRPGDEANFALTFRRVAGIQDRILPGAKLVFSPDEGEGDPSTSPDVRKLWPGKDANGINYADVYSVDQYNGWPFVRTPAEFQTKINRVDDNGGPVGIETHRRFAASVGAPFAISEWGSNGDPASAEGGGESPVFVQEMNKWLRSCAGDISSPRPGQCLYDIQFNLWRQFELWPTTIQPQTGQTYRSLTWGR